MPTLFPPDYPDRPDAPLLSFGPSFAEEISRSVIGAVWHENDEQPHETEVRVAAALTMLEAFHPRDHLECMLAAQGVACHAAIMECFRRAMRADTPEATAIKLRSNATQLNRTFSVVLHDLERRQSKPLPERPPALPPESRPPPGDPPPGISPPNQAIPGTPLPEAALAYDNAAERPDDIEKRPDGTPGSLAAYAPKPPEEVFVPSEAPINLALATRPKQWHQVNTPLDRPASGKVPPTDIASVPPLAPPAPDVTRGPLQLTERLFSGDALAHFTSARFDPDAPVEPHNFDHEDSVVELEMISAGGDPEAEAERQAMMAAHPEGKPIRTLRYGRMPPPEEKPDNPPDDA